MTMLITGANGFIGRNILEHFSGKYATVAPTSRELDLTDECAVRDFLAAQKVDIVIHSAVRPGHRNAPDSSKQLFINSRMFFNLVRHSNLYKRFIFLGSGSEYDIRNNLAKIREQDFDTHVPLDEGGFSKYLASKYMEANPGTMLNLRLFGIFGRHEDYLIRFISNAICKTLFGLAITIRQNRRFDYLYVDDLMPVLEHCIENRMNHAAYNVTPDRAVDLLSIAEMVRTRSGKDLPIDVGQPGMGLEYSGDNLRLRQEIPSLSFTPITEAIDRLYSWYDENIHLIDREKLLVDR